MQNAKNGTNHPGGGRTAAKSDLAPDAGRLFSGHRDDLSWKFLGLLLLLALTARCWWLLSRVTVIEGEGANYARMAENIALGKGWIGTQGHLQVFYPPLYPLLIAGTYPLFHDAEIAGRLISILFGTFLVIPIFLIAREWYGQSVGYLAGMIVALHPVLVGISAAVFSESTYLCILFLAFYWGLRSAIEQSYGKAIAAGALFGLAYLTRTESLMETAFLAVLVLLCGRKDKSKAVGVAACLSLACILVGAPYVWFLKSHTGQFRLEAKSANNFAFGKMRLAGESWEPAYRRVDDNLNPVGLSMRTDLDVLQTTKFSLPIAAQILRLAAHDNIRSFAGDLLEERAVGGFVLIGLVSLGLFSSPWSRERVAGEMILMVFLLCLFLPILSLVDYFNFRYVVPILLILVLWTAKGIAEFAGWSGNTVQAVLRSPDRARWGRTGGLLVAAGALLLVAWPAVNHIDNLRGDDPALKTVGLRLKGLLSNGPVVMDTDNRIAFYSGGIYRPYPYASQATALRYIAANNVAALVIKERNAETNNPYYQNWAAGGIPEPGASLILSVPSKVYGKILVYRLR